MKIYILCPPNFFTGGPLGLHQLCKELVERQYDAFIYYPMGLTNWYKDPVHENYRHFQNPMVRRIEDSKDNILIVPEIFTEYFRNFTKVRKVVWWLSVDNYLVYNDHFANSFIGKLKKMIGKGPLRIQEINNIVDINLAQSIYSYDFLSKNGLKNPKMLHDYIPEGYFEDFSISKKKDLVLYNPKKGLDFTMKLIKRDSGIDFVPLINLTPSEVINLLLISKVYIDFGEHPGRDRFPREAALLGNVVICGRKGSASNAKDINIPESYKFDNAEESIGKIELLVKEIFGNFDFHINSQEVYRDTIKRGKTIFQSEVGAFLELLFSLK
jgi:hypothetical protein